MSRVSALGFIANADASQDRLDALNGGLRELGYVDVDGQNIAIEWRFAEASNPRFEEIAARWPRQATGARRAAEWRR